MKNIFLAYKLNTSGIKKMKIQDNLLLFKFNILNNGRKKTAFNRPLSINQEQL